MDAHGWIALLVLAAAIALCVRKALPLEITSLAIPLVLLATGVLSAGDAFSGFASRAAIGIACMFVVGAALQEAGITTLVSRALQRLGGGSETLLILGVTVVGLLLSAFMSTVAAVTLFIPGVMGLARRTGVSPSRLLMPLSFGAVLGCNLFLVSSVPNMVVASRAAEEGIQLGMLSFTRYGWPIVLVGLACVAFVGRRVLPSHASEDRLRVLRLPEEVAKSYGLTRSLYRLRVVKESSVVGRTIAASGIRSGYGLDVVAVVRPRTVGEEVLDPRPDLKLAAGDEVYVEGDDEAAWRLADYETLQYCLAGPSDVERLLGRGMMVAEVALSPRSDQIGKTLRQLDFRNTRGLNVLSVWHRGDRKTQDVADLGLEFGDVLLVSGPAGRVKDLARDSDWVVFTDLSASEDLSRAPLALLALLIAVLPVALFPGHVPFAASSLAAALFVVLSRTLTLHAAQHALDWRVLFLVIGFTPLGLALEKHGLAETCAALVGTLGEHAGPFAGYGVLFVIASVLGMSAGNTPAAVLMAPVAAQLGTASGLEPERALIAVSFGASCAFMLPIHAWNLVIAGPGGYSPRDFLRLGLPVTVAVIVAGVASLALMP